MAKVALWRAWEHVKLWLDWHGRVATVLAIVVSLGGAALVNRIAAVWGNVTGVYLWIVSVLVFVIFACGLILAGRSWDNRKPVSERAEAAFPTAEEWKELASRFGAIHHSTSIRADW